MFKEERRKSYRLIAGCVLIFAIGLFLRDTVSIKENPLLGNTFYIIVGNLLMACSLIGVGLLLRKLYRLKKKEKRKKSGSKVHFLDEKERRRYAGRE